MIWLLSACTGPSTPPATVPADTSDPVDTDTDTDIEPQGEWEFEPVDGMVCGGGAPTGIGVNRGSDPSKLVVYMVGGGACWDALTCFVLATANNLEANWGEANLQAEIAAVEASGLLDRSDATSPVRDATWVYIPYCTGDLQIGNKLQYYDPFSPTRATHHVGDNNLTAALERLSGEQPSLDRLWLVGGSAGAYAAQLQAHRFRSTWPSADFRVFADGAPMIQPGEYRWGLWQTAWDARLPPDCPDCEASLPAVLARQASAMPEVPFALATTTEDQVITLFFAQPLGGLNGPQSALIADQYTPSDQLSVFRVEGTAHVLLGNPSAVVHPNGTVLEDWFWQWADGTDLPDAP
jgi:hypothetical protein